MFRLCLMLTLVVSAVPASAEEVAKLYKQSCAICHDSGMAGSPKTHDQATWEPRLAKDMNELIKSVVDGMGAMPAKGMCKECTHEDYKALIEYMLPQD